MATDRQTPCLYYVCAGLCKKGRKADHAHYCQHCNKYKPRARVRYKNQKKEKLEKIRKEERYQSMSTINIEEIRTSNDLKKEKCNEVKEAIRDILSEDQLEEFDGVFDNVVGRVFKGVMLKEKE